ncbi:hypothetical protein [Bradyrhizobium sp. USDA 3240]
MLPERPRENRLSSENAVLAHLEHTMRGKHRERRQAPQDNQELSCRRPPARRGAADQHERDGDACDHDEKIARPAQRHEIRIIAVDARKDESESGDPEQDNADAFADLHETTRGRRGRSASSVSDEIRRREPISGVCTQSA